MESKRPQETPPRSPLEGDVYRSQSRSSIDGEAYRSAAPHSPVPLNRGGISEPVFRSLAYTPSVPVPKAPVKASDIVKADISSLSDSFKSSLLPFDHPGRSVDIEPPPIPGGYLEPSSHLFSRISPVILFDELQNALETLSDESTTGKVDITDCEPKQFKLRCVAYKPGEPSLTFFARVWRGEPDGKGKRYAIELQRRTGDTLHFCDIWGLMKRHFIGKDLVESARKESRGFPKKRVAPVLAEIEVTPEQIKSTLNCLVQMASSECVDVKCQAIQALAKIAISDCRSKEQMACENCLNILVASIESKMEDVHRCAVHALTNLIRTSADIGKAIADKGGVKKVCELVQNTETVQVHRECFNFLESILSKLGAKSMDEDVRKTLKLLSASKNLELQQKALSLEKTLTAV